MNVKAISLRAEVLIDGSANDAPVEHAGAQANEFAALLFLIFAAPVPAERVMDTDGSFLNAASEELNLDPKISHAGQLPGNKTGVIDPASGEALDQLHPANGKSLEKAAKVFASEMHISQSIPPEPERRDSLKGPSGAETNADDDREFVRVAHSQLGSAKNPLGAPYGVQASVRVNGQGAASPGEPQQSLSGNDPVATHITDSPQINSHDAAQADREANPKGSTVVMQSELSEGDPPKMRSDPRLSNITVDRPVPLNSDKGTDVFQAVRKDPLVQGPVTEHNPSRANTYLFNAPGQPVPVIAPRQPVPVIRAERTNHAATGEPLARSRADSEGELDSLVSSESVNEMHSPDVPNGKQKFSNPQNDTKPFGEPFQIATETKVENAGRDAGPVQVTHAADKVPATSAREPHGVDWDPIINRVIGEIRGRIRIGRQQAVLQLDPAELGKVQIDLHMEGEKLAARILTETPESRALIEAHLPELRQALVENQVELVEVRIENGSWAGQRGQDQRAQQEAGTWRQAARVFGDPKPVDSEEHELARPASQLLERGRISMWA